MYHPTFVALPYQDFLPQQLPHMISLRPVYDAIVGIMLLHSTACCHSGMHMS